MPAFGHRHYAAIADVLADAREALNPDRPGTHTARVQTINDLEARLIKLFKADNAGFKPERFERAARRDPGMHGKDRVR